MFNLKFRNVGICSYIFLDCATNKETKYVKYISASHTKLVSFCIDHMVSVVITCAWGNFSKQELFANFFLPVFFPWEVY